VRNIPQELDLRLREQEDDRDYDYNHCSEAGWVVDCMRRLVLLRRMPPKSADIDVSMKRRFAEGHRQETLMRAELKEAGFSLLPLGPDSLVWEEYRLKGLPDDTIYLDEKLPNVIDYKSCSPYVFSEVKRFNRWEDFLKSKYPWIRHAVGQTMLYIPLLQQNDYDIDPESSILYFKDKSSGEKHQVIIYYDDPFVQILLNGLETINNEEAERMLTRLNELEKGKKEYKELYDKLRTEFLGRNVIIGDFKVTTTDYPQSTYQIPPEIKEQYKQSVQRQRFNIDKLTKVL